MTRYLDECGLDDHSQEYLRNMLLAARYLNERGLDDHSQEY